LYESFLIQHKIVYVQEYAEKQIIKKINPTAVTKMFYDSF